MNAIMLGCITAALMGWLITDAMERNEIAALKRVCLAPVDANADFWRNEVLRAYRGDK